MHRLNKQLCTGSTSKKHKLLAAACPLLPRLSHPPHLEVVGVIWHVLCLDTEQLSFPLVGCDHLHVQATAKARHSKRDKLSAAVSSSKAFRAAPLCSARLFPALSDSLAPARTNRPLGRLSRPGAQSQIQLVDRQLRPLDKPPARLLLRAPTQSVKPSGCLVTAELDERMEQLLCVARGGCRASI